MTASKGMSWQDGKEARSGSSAGTLNLLKNLIKSPEEHGLVN
jgi:hypothetical protein